MDLELLESHVLASVNLDMRASYSASLFIERKPHCIACWIKSSSGEVRTRSMLVPLKLLEPSTEKVHLDVERSVRLSNSLST